MGLFNCMQIAVSMYLCYRILSAQVVTRSMNDTMNYLLMLPIGACLGVTSSSWWMGDLNWALYWIPYAFLFVSLIQVGERYVVLLVCICLSELTCPLSPLSVSLAQILQVPLGIAGGRLKAPKILFL